MAAIHMIYSNHHQIACFTGVIILHISLTTISSLSFSFLSLLKVGWLCWGLTSQSTIFQSYRDGAIASWVINQYFRGVKCLAQGHNTAAVGLEPRTSRSGVRHSTTEPPRSPLLKECVILGQSVSNDEGKQLANWCGIFHAHLILHLSLNNAGPKWTKRMIQKSLNAIIFQHVSRRLNWTHKKMAKLMNF